MRQVEPASESGSVEDLHYLRMMAPLHELVREKGNGGAAAVLGIDPRTVASCMRGERMSWQGRAALERGLQSGQAGRWARDAFLEALKSGTVLRRAVAHQRMLNLEIELIGKHELTLPPATYPWDRFDRRDEVWERTQYLKRVRIERNWALLRRWLRRVITLGLWKK